MFLAIARFLVTVALALTALILHELAHVFAVKYLGGKVEKVGFFPLGIAARFTGLERLRAWERYVIYGAGAIANIIAAAWTLTVSRLSYFGVSWLEEFALYSIALAVFNLVPALPLDGGRILHQFISNRKGILIANRFMIKLSTKMSIALFMLGIVQLILYGFNISLLCAALYIRHKNKELPPILHMDFFKFLQAKNDPARGRIMPVRHVTIHAGTSIKQAMETLTIDHHTVFTFQEKKEYSSITEKALLAHVYHFGLRDNVAALLPGDGP